MIQDAELIDGGDGPRHLDLSHLALNRGLIVKRSLLASAVGGAVPLPVLDDYVASRVRAGMLMKIAEKRQVDLPAASAELLADPREGTAVRNATLTAAALLALKLAWKKLFAVLAAGRRADEMASTYQAGILFDHYCARLHVGPAIDRPRAARLHAVIQESLAHTEKGALVAVFREGAAVLGRSALEAPGWVSQQMQRLTERWVKSGGRPEVDIPEEEPSSSGGAGDSARWLDRATRAVEGRLHTMGQGYTTTLVEDFERRWREALAAAEKAAAGAAEPK